MMMANLRIPLTILYFLLLCGLSLNSCHQEGNGFALPQGDIARGKAAFVKLHCNECHNVTDIEWAGNPDELKVTLGGGVPFKKTYADLVTSIINPSHKIAKQYYEQDTSHPDGSSKMAIYNEVMTVQQLTDIVTFLEGAYKIERPITNYPIF